MWVSLNGISMIIKICILDTTTYTIGLQCAWIMITFVLFCIYTLVVDLLLVYRGWSTHKQITASTLYISAEKYLEMPRYCQALICIFEYIVHITIYFIRWWVWCAIYVYVYHTILYTLIFNKLFKYVKHG